MKLQPTPTPTITGPSSGGSVSLRPVFGTGPKGDTGDQGETGPQGEQGPAGYNATGAAEDLETLTDYVNETAGPNDFASALKASIESAITARTVTTLDLPNWRAALALAKAGTADAKILCVGDSTTIGTDTVAGDPQSYPYALADLLDAETDLIAAHGLAVPSKAIQADPRWAFGAGWDEEAYGWAKNSVHRGAAGCSDQTFTDTTVTADRWDLYYLRTAGGSTITAQATGGSAVVQSTDGVNAVMKVTIEAPSASTSNVVTISNTGAGYIHIVGIEPWHSTQKRVRVGNAGVAGAGTVAWADPAGGFGGLECVRAYGPDLTIISLGVNDGFVPYSIETYTDNLQLIIDAALESGDVLLWSPVPSKAGVDSNRLTYEPLYNAVMADMGVPYLDLYPRWGVPGSSGSWTAFMKDGLHPNQAGNADIAAFLAPTVLNEDAPLALRDELLDLVGGRAESAITETFTTSGTWTKPAGAKAVQVFLVGAGGGGGGGSRGTSGANLGGGGGGGGGGVTMLTVPADSLPSSVTVTVPAGGTGGAARTSDSLTGNAGGVASGNTVFWTLSAQRGGAGAGGVFSSSAAGGVAGVGTSSGGAGGASATGALGANGAAVPGAPGGGGGGGVSTAPAATVGGSGGLPIVLVATAGTGGAVNTSGGNGSAGAVPGPGGGGGGGGASTTTTAGSGGNGGNYGAGGGGGGAAVNGQTSGAGGNGAGGLCVVTTYF